MDELAALRRRTFLIALGFGGIASVIGYFNTLGMSAASAIDIAVAMLHMIALPALLFVYIREPRYQSQVEVSTIAIVCLGFAARLVYATLGPNRGLSLSDVFPPFSPWVPVIFVLAFVVLEKRRAFAVSLSFYLLTAPCVIYFLLHRLPFEDQPAQLIAIFNQYVFAHPVYIALLSLIPGLRSSYQHAVDERISMEDLANTDPLTRTLNRRGLETRINELTRVAISRDCLFSVIDVRLPGFGTVSERFGVEARDHLLQHVADILRFECREHDLPGRWSGGEFCVILPKTVGSTATDVATRIQKHLDRSTFGDLGRIHAIVTVTEAQVDEAVDDFLRRLHESVAINSSTEPERPARAS